MKMENRSKGSQDELESIEKCSREFMNAIDTFSTEVIDDSNIDQRLKFFRELSKSSTVLHDACQNCIIEGRNIGDKDKVRSQKVIDEKFQAQEIFMELVTTGFGEHIDSIRKNNNSQPDEVCASILSETLRNGMDFYSDEKISMLLGDADIFSKEANVINSDDVSNSLTTPHALQRKKLAFK